MKKNARSGQIGLTLLFSSLVFGILLLSILLSGVISYLLSRWGFLSSIGIELEGGVPLLIIMVIISSVIGAALAMLSSRFIMRPINRMIDQINRLASGDFKARLVFQKPLHKHPSFLELSKSFNTLARELDRTEILRSDFVNNFSHEFKTPIVSIAGFAKLLKRGCLPPEQQKEYLTIIEEESLRLASMTTNVLHLTKLENQTILTDVSTFNLSEQLRFCVLLLEDKWERKVLTLDMEFDEYEVRANEEMLRQVWINLLDNAIKFSPPTGEIKLEIGETGGQLAVAITNYGPDIEPHKLDKIWGKFYQADESHAAQGNGIGLAIVKYVVELHGGIVWVSSAGGQTTFRVSLPKCSSL